MSDQRPAVNIEFRDVGKQYGTVSVLRHLTLDIREREFMVLVGPSGCGKTTALRLIAGLEQLSAGELLIANHVMNAVPPRDRDVAMVFQNYALYPQMTVRENLAFGLKVRKTPRGEVERQVSETADMLGLGSLLDRRPKELSGGQRQRVALGRAIVRKPAVFLFDEPLSNLDADLRVSMRAELVKLQRRLQTTVVYVTHDQTEAMTLAHRMAVLAPLAPGNPSNLQQVGSPLDLYDRPANVFVARFLGTPAINVLTVAVGGDGRLTAPAFTAAPPARFATALKGYAGRTLLLGIRPEDASLPGERRWSNTATLTGTLELLESTGDQSIVHLRIGDSMFVAKLDALRDCNRWAAHDHRGLGSGAGGRFGGFGERLELMINCDAMHLFDPDTACRLSESDG